MNSANSVFEIVQNYIGSGLWALVMGLAILYLILSQKERKRRFLIFIIVFFLLFNDVTYKIASKLGEGETFYRLLWILPIVVVAWAYVDCLSRVKNVRRKTIVVVVSIIGVCLFSKYPENINPISEQSIVLVNEETQEISNYIRESLDDGCTAVVLGPKEALVGIRQYNAYINLSTSSEVALLQRAIDEDYSSLSGWAVRSSVENAQLDYVIVARDLYGANNLFESGGCTIIGSTKNYNVYDTNRRNYDFDGLDYSKNDSASFVGWEALNLLSKGQRELYVYTNENKLIQIDDKGKTIGVIFEGVNTIEYVERDEYILCAINNEDLMVSQETMMLCELLSKKEKPILLFLNKPVYTSSIQDGLGMIFMGEDISRLDETTNRFVNWVKGNDSNIKEVFTCGSTLFCKLMLENNAYECVAISDSEKQVLYLEVQ